MTAVSEAEQHLAELRRGEEELRAKLSRGLDAVSARDLVAAGEAIVLAEAELLEAKGARERARRERRAQQTEQLLADARAALPDLPAELREALHAAVSALSRLRATAERHEAVVTQLADRGLGLGLGEVAVGVPLRVRPHHAGTEGIPAVRVDGVQVEAVRPDARLAQAVAAAGFAGEVAPFDLAARKADERQAHPTISMRTRDDQLAAAEQRRLRRKQQDRERQIQHWREQIEAGKADALIAALRSNAGGIEPTFDPEFERLLREHRAAQESGVGG